MKYKHLLRNNSPFVYKKLSGLKYDYYQRKFKKKYPKTIIFTESKRKLYSQENQDYIVYSNFFNNKKNGVFCDVGGNHPLTINNTRYFEEIGWTGFVFEPLPHMQELWKKHRKAKFFPFAASDTEGEVNFSIVESLDGWEDMLSFVKKNADITKVRDRKIKDINVQTRCLKNVFYEENIINIDYMSIDVEGHELSVIKGIDFKKVRINVLTIENNISPKVYYGDDNIREIMLNNDYILWGRIPSLDDIYVHKDYLKTI